MSDITSAAVLGLLITIAGAVLHMAFRIGRFVEAFDAHERRLTILEKWRDSL